MPGLPSAADFAAYNAARTPTVNITLNPVATGGVSPSGAARSAAAPVQQAAQREVSTQITLPPAPPAKSTASRAGATAASSNSQPVATVLLTYDSSGAGNAVWVRMLRGGTLTATDSTGKTYDGSRGFFLTLDASGTATFNYQAPNASGTYQVLTRFSNVATPLTFTVPDPAP